LARRNFPCLGICFPEKEMTEVIRVLLWKKIGLGSRDEAAPARECGKIFVRHQQGGRFGYGGRSPGHGTVELLDPADWDHSCAGFLSVGLLARWRRQ